MASAAVVGGREGPAPKIFELGLLVGREDLPKAVPERLLVRLHRLANGLTIAIGILASASVGFVAGLGQSLDLGLLVIGEPELVLHRGKGRSLDAHQLDLDLMDSLYLVGGQDGLHLLVHGLPALSHLFGTRRRSTATAVLELLAHLIAKRLELGLLVVGELDVSLDVRSVKESSNAVVV